MKINEDIAKTKAKIIDYQLRLRELERKKLEMENAEIVAIIRSSDIAPENLQTFIKSLKQPIELQKKIEPKGADHEE